MNKNIIRNLLTSFAFAGIMTTIACGNDPSQDGILVPKIVVDDLALLSATINGVKLHISMTTVGTPGANDNIVFLHGGPGYDYRALEPLKNLVDDSVNNHRYVLYDQRGGGLSQRLDPSDSTLSVAGHVADLEAIRTSASFFNGGTMKIVAHSWGGALAQAYMKSYPNRVTKIVFIASMPAKNTNSDDLLTSIFNTAAGDYTWQRNLLGESHAELDFRFINFLPAQTYYYCNAEDYKKVRYWRFGYAAVIKTLENGMLAGAVTGPSVTYNYDFTASNAAVSSVNEATYIVGSCDTKLGATAANSIRNTLTVTPSSANNTVVTVANAGHYVFTDQLDAVATQVIAGLQ